MAQNMLNIKTVQAFTNASLRIINAGGQVVSQQMLKGNGTVQVNIANLTAGMYYVDIINNGTRQKFQFIKR